VIPRECHLSHLPFVQIQCATPSPFDISEFMGRHCFASMILFARKQSSSSRRRFIDGRLTKRNLSHSKRYLRRMFHVCDFIRIPYFPFGTSFKSSASHFQTMLQIRIVTRIQFHIHGAVPSCMQSLPFSTLSKAEDSPHRSHDVPSLRFTLTTTITVCDVP
jgi:hypothetical protein